MESPADCPNVALDGGVASEGIMRTPDSMGAREAEVVRRLAALGVREEDLEETFVRSGGPGGQNVNKTATCVVLLHRPTGLRVRCQATRHQGQNRWRARELLIEKLEAVRRARREAAQALAAKVRRQKRGRSRGAKERMLADKSRRSARKEGRRRVETE